MRRVVWSPAARADLARIDDFNAEHDPDFADRVARAAIAAADFLAEFPAAGPVVRGLDRKWRVPGTDFILVYHASVQGVEIVRTYHARENWRQPR